MFHGVESILKKILGMLALTVGIVFGFAQAQEGVLRVSVVSEATSLDPITTNNIPSRLIFMQIHDALVMYDEELNLVPALASSWEISEDGTQYVFTMRNGVSFHNGDPVTAHDVVYAFEQSQNPALQGQWLGILGGVESIVADGDDTVVLTLEAPDSSFLDQIVYLGIPNSRVHQEIGADAYAINPVGTGPFKFVSWARNDKLVLAANEDYWVATPNLAGVEFRAIPERSVAALELEAGASHIAQQLSSDDLIRLENHGSITIGSTPTLSYYYVALNNETGPFADKLVRQALLYAIPMDQFIDTIFQGVGAIRAYTSLAPTNQAYDESFVADFPEYNPERAKELLAEAGYPNGFATTLYTPTDSNRKQLGELVQVALSQVGIKVDLRAVEFGTMLPLTYSGDAPMWILGWTNGVDPNNYLYEMFHSDPAAWAEDGTTFNTPRYNNPEVDAQLEEARIITDMAERVEIYKDVARTIFLEDAVHVAGYHQTSTLAYLNSVHDVVVDPNSGILLVTPYNNVWVD